MHRDEWRQLEITPEQRNARRINSAAYEADQAAEELRERAKEPSERFMPVVEEEEYTPTKEQAQQDAEIAEREYFRGYRFADRRKAAKLLADTLKHRIVLGDEFDRYLRAMSGWRQKDDLPAQEPAAYDQHAMGFQEQ